MRSMCNHRPDLIQKNEIDAIMKLTSKYELHDGLLYRRAFDPVDCEIQLRCCAPQGNLSTMEYPGIGKRKLIIRNRICLEYHNGRLSGHQGRDRTLDLIEKDWWWPTMGRDVCHWCETCTHCASENRMTGASAWTRTELNSRPFRVIQFDIVNCQNSAGGLTERSICLLPSACSVDGAGSSRCWQKRQRRSRKRLCRMVEFPAHACVW